MSTHNITNPYPVGSNEAVAFSAWIDARYTLMEIGKQIVQLLEERQEAYNVYTQRFRAIRGTKPFIWDKQSEYAQMSISERDAMNTFVQAEKQLIRCIGRLPIIHLE